MPRTDLVFNLCEHGFQKKCSNVANVPSLLITVYISCTLAEIAETSFTNLLLVSREFGGNACNFIIPIWPVACTFRLGLCA